MRSFAWLACALLVVGCGPQPTTPLAAPPIPSPANTLPPTSPSTPLPPPTSTKTFTPSVSETPKPNLPDYSVKWQPTVFKDDSKAPAPQEVPDLGTRKTGSDWACFLGPLKTSTSTETGMIAPWPREGLRLVWHQKVGNGYGMPSISKGRLFQLDRRGNTICLTVLKSETGEFLWKHEYPTQYEDIVDYGSGTRCCPVVEDDRVYIFGPDGWLKCLNVVDGKVIWQVDTTNDFHVRQNFFGVGSTPVIEGDLLITQVGGSTADDDDVPFPSLKGHGSAVVAFNKFTGKVRYKVGNELASYAGPVLTTIGERRWGFIFARGGLFGFNPTTGTADFHYPWRARAVASVNAANPIVVGDKVFITECYEVGSTLLKVQPGNCEVVWKDSRDTRLKSMMTHWMTPIYHDGYVYACTGRHETNAELRCIELNTGKVKWSQRGMTRTSLLMVEGHFICLTEDGLLLLLKVNPEKYDEVSRIDSIYADGDKTTPLLREPCWAAPILSHGLLYVRGRDELVCLELIPEKK